MIALCRFHLERERQQKCHRADRTQAGQYTDQRAAPETPRKQNKRLVGVSATEKPKPMLAMSSTLDSQESSGERHTETARQKWHRRSAQSPARRRLLCANFAPRWRAAAKSSAKRCVSRNPSTLQHQSETQPTSPSVARDPNPAFGLRSFRDRSPLPFAGERARQQNDRQNPQQDRQVFGKNAGLRHAHGAERKWPRKENIAGHAEQNRGQPRYWIVSSV